jgi:hypothetical protein
MLKYHRAALAQEEALQQGWDRLQNHIPAVLKEGIELAVHNGNLMVQAKALVDETVAKMVCLDPHSAHVLAVFAKHVPAGHRQAADNAAQHGQIVQAVESTVRGVFDQLITTLQNCLGAVGERIRLSDPQPPQQTQQTRAPAAEATTPPATHKYDGLCLYRVFGLQMTVVNQSIVLSPALAFAVNADS